MMRMICLHKVLSIDLETYSSEDIKNTVYKYVEADDFEILLFGYSFDGEPAKVIDLTKDSLPIEVSEALHNPNVLKTAFNASFEIACLKKYFPHADYDNWQCTKALSDYCTLPSTLESVAKALGLEAQKDRQGKNLIKYFSMPCKPTKANGMRHRNLPVHDVEKWQQFIDYCRQDVEVEKAIRDKLIKYNLTTTEWEIWKLDNRINSRGIKIDRTFVNNAISFDDEYKNELIEECKNITNLDNPNSVAQLSTWLELDGLTKEIVNTALQDDNISEDKKRVLEIRQRLGKTSIKKYQAMINSACNDDRCRGMFQFYGANRTGRWAGRVVQLQNLPRNYIDELDFCRNMVKNGEYDHLLMFYDNVSDILSQLIRTAFIGENKAKLCVADYSAIEARVIAWLAGEQWRQDVFKTTGKIYEASASMMFHVPVETIVKGHENYELRQKGKVAELALGYQGGVNALISMGALKGGIKESELTEIVAKWRKASPNIVAFWQDVESNAKKAIIQRKAYNYKNLVFDYVDGNLKITLPSGRKLTYLNAKIGLNKFGSEAIVYQGTGLSGTLTNQETYGGKLVENIVQAVARDCLAWAMLSLDKAGYKIVAHVHDEVIIEDGNLKDIIDIMCVPTLWSDGLVLSAAGFECDYYMKD